MKLQPKDLYALGVDRGGIDERWLASTTNADNGPDTPEDEGLSYIVIGAPGSEEKVLLKDAVELLGEDLLGKETMQKHGGWAVLSKLFDNKGAIPFHMHQNDEHAQNVNCVSKPEAYYFPVQLNLTTHSFPYSFFGLEPGTTKEDIYECLRRWNEGDNGILDYSKAYRLKPGTGWDVPAGILHAPGSLVTYELQGPSDVFAQFQSIIEGKAVPWGNLVKYVPESHHQDLDYIMDMLDWELNVDPHFKENRFREPKPVQSVESMEAEGYIENWVIYGNEKFSAKELTVMPGQKVVIKDDAAYGLLLIQGNGTIQGKILETSTMIQYGQLTYDEYFVSASAAQDGIVIENRSEVESLVMLKHFGPL
jgi:mannose-6-phosphate isomerase class I